MKNLKFYHAVLQSSKLYVNSQLLKMNRCIHNLSCEEKPNVKNNDNKISTLYVPGRYGGQIYQIVKPYIDINYIEKNLKVIDESCCVRNIKLDLQLLLNFLKEWSIKQNEWRKIGQEINEFEAEQKRLKSLNFMAEAEEIKKHIDSNVGRLKKAKENVNDAEDILMPLVQKIPNIVDPETPMKEPFINVFQEPQMYDIKSCSHIEIALSLLEFLNSNPTVYYLKGPLAELELLAQDYFSKKLQEVEFAPLSCVDFCKSFILEAAGSDPHSLDQCIPLKDGRESDIGQKCNLVGGASFEAFLVYLTNMNTDRATLPVKYFCIGRHYDAANRNNPGPSLFSAVQSSRIHGVVLSFHESLEFKTLLDTLVSCYLPLKIPLRTVDLPVHLLNTTESRKTQLELWSPAEQQFVPVAHVSQRNDFVSKRLQITYGKDYFVEGYCCITESVIVNFPVLLGCIIENNVKGNYVNFEEIFKLFNI